MKKTLSLFLGAIFLFLVLCRNVYAYTYTEIDAIEKVKIAENLTKENLDALIDWSNDYANDLALIIDRNFIVSINSANFEKSIDLIIIELNKIGNSGAANALLSIKGKLVNNYSGTSNALDVVLDYLLDEENLNNGVIGSTDLFIQIRSSLRNLKNSFNKLGRIYYNLNYNKLKTEIESYKSLEDIVKIYDEHLEQLNNMAGLTSKIVKLQNWERIYLIYLTDYEELLNEYFGEYYNKIYEIYDKLYLTIESELNNTFKGKISTIINNTNLNNNESIINRNTKLTEIINYLSKNKNELISNFNETNNIININFIKKELSKLENKVVTKIDESINYANSLIIDISGLNVKNEIDKKDIIIDNNSGIILTYLTNLNYEEFINKLSAGANKVEKSNLYNGNIGTLSKIKVVLNNSVIEEYTIVVKGDINPNGKFDITDVVKLCNDLFNKENLTDIYFIAADMNDDGKTDITDVVKLCNLLFK